MKTNIVAFRRQLRAMNADLEQKGNRLATAAAARVFRAAVARTAPLGATGMLRRSIFVFRSRRSRRPNTIYAVSVRSHRRRKIDRKTKKVMLDAYYWGWVEAGHLARGPGQALRGGNRRKALERARLRRAGAAFVPGRWYFRRAFATSSSEAVRAYERRLAKEVARMTAVPGR